MNILYFAPIDWDYIRQRPQHLAQRIAGRFSFYYIQPFGLRNLRLSDFPRVVKRLSGLFRTPNPRENLYIVNLKFIPLINRYIQSLNAYLLKKQIEPLADKGSIIWITNPSRIIPDLLKGLKPGAMVYELIDDNEKIHRAQKKDIMETERWLFSRVDLIIVTSSKLYEKTRKINPGKQIVLISNGVEYDFFNKDHYEKPAELAGMKKIAGYVGSVDSWMNFETLQFIADKRKDLDFVFVGPVKVGNLPSGDNIHFLGTRDYDTIPDYCHFFDVCLIPFTASDFADSINPVKLFEYFALGKPVVAHVMRELMPYREELYLSSDKTDFLDKLDMALSERDPRIRQKRKEIAMTNDWSFKAKSILSVLAKLKNVGSVES